MSEFDLHNPQPLMIVISGPSGAGKDTVMQRMQERGMPFHFVVTATTRQKRANDAGTFTNTSSKPSAGGDIVWSMLLRGTRSSFCVCVVPDKRH